MHGNAGSHVPLTFAKGLETDVGYGFGASCTAQ
jgi:hypothetical protein